MKDSEVTIKNAVGLHARPAAMFVQTAKKFTSDITVTFKGKTVNSKSLLSLLTLGVTKDSTILIQAEGDDEEAAIAALESLIQSNFGESE